MSRSFSSNHSFVRQRLNAASLPTSLAQICATTPPQACFTLIFQNLTKGRMLHKLAVSMPAFTKPQPV
eukprot:1906880-Amphidinium_carterae.1